MWAWGCCLALAVSGRALFGGDHVHAILSAVMNHQPDPRGARRRTAGWIPSLARVVEAAIHPDPYRRPADGAALLRLLPPAGAWTSPPARGHGAEHVVRPCARALTGGPRLTGESR